MKTTKKLITMLLALVMVFSMLIPALAADVEGLPEGASFEYVDADAIGVPGSGLYVYIASELYNPEPMLMPIILVYPNNGYADANAAWKAMNDYGLLDIAENEHAAVMMINPVGDTWGKKDHDVFRSIVTKVCAAKNGSTIFGFYTYCTMISAIGEGSGATFINQYLTQDCNRLAAVVTFGGDVPEGMELYTPLPAFVSGASENALNYYKAVNKTNMEKTVGSYTEYYNELFPTQRVVVRDRGSSFSKSAIADAWKYVVRRTTRNALGDPLWQYPNTYDILPLMPRPMIDELGLTRNECSDLEAMPWQSRWYEWVPDEVFDTMADPEDSTTYPLVMCYHGSGDHPIFEAESNGWVNMAGEARFILVAPESNGNASRNMTLIQHLIDKYPIDVSRIYVTGFSMGTSNLNSTAAAYADFFAAAAPSANASPSRAPYNDTVAANSDLPIYETACSNDLYATRANPRRLSSFAAINSELKLNNIGIQLGASEPDYVTYPFYGFDIFEVADTVTEYSAHGIPFNVSTFKNEAGVPMVKFRVAMGQNHNHYTEFARDIWNYFKCFSRDQETKAVIYTAPEVIVGSTAKASCGEGQKATVDFTYNGTKKVSSFRAHIMKNGLADPVVTSKYDFEFNPANGNVIVYTAGEIKNGDVLFSVTYDLSKTPWYEDGAYAVKLQLIEATNDDNELVDIDTSAGYVVIDNIVVKGDVTQDGEMTNADLIMIARYLVELVKFNAKQLEAADFNSDGIVDNRDLVLISRALVVA